jgi:beta-glucosidase
MKQLLLAVALVCCCGANAQDYKDRTLSPEKRAQDLLSRLTIEEKVALMQNNSAGIERLGVRPYEWWNEALHGVARSGRATVFPQAIGMAASFDAPLLYNVFSAVSDEGRVKNRIARQKGSRLRYQGLTFWTPNINIFRDPRWGRGQETYGEDPFLTSIMGQAVVCGLQGTPFLTPEEEWDYNTQRNITYDQHPTPNTLFPTLKAHACAKHFAVHSGPEWNRHTYNAENINPRDLYETYLPAFKDLVQKAHVQEVMCAYNRYEGDPCCGSDRLLTHILRNDWGYEGLVVSDCGAIDDFYRKGHHEVTASNVEASAMAVLSGTDLECGQSYRGLVEAVQRGLIKESDIDRSVMRLLKSRFELGEMDDTSEWDILPDSLLDSNGHRQLSLQMARESIVLLQNNEIPSGGKGEGLLPLTNEKLQALNRQLGINGNARIAVIGPNANDSVMMWAN